MVSSAAAYAAAADGEGVRAAAAAPDTWLFMMQAPWGRRRITLAQAHG